MTPARTLFLKNGLAVRLYVWWELNGYFAAFFVADKVPLIVDSEFLKPGTFFGPYVTHRDAETTALNALQQVVSLEANPISSAVYS